MALIAHSSDLSLFDLLQVKGMGRATCRIAVSCRGRRGFLALRSGVIVYATYGRRRGDEAAYAILQEPDVDYRLTHDVVNLESNMQLEHDVLLMETVRRMDERAFKAGLREQAEAARH